MILKSKLLLGSFAFLSITFVAWLAFPRSPGFTPQILHQPSPRPLGISYKEIVRQSDLTVLGTVTAIDFKKGIYGYVSYPDKPYFTTYQFITISPRTFIKGYSQITPLVFREAKSFSGVSFVENETVIVALKWYDDSPPYGKYYALVGILGVESKLGKFSITQNLSSHTSYVTNDKLMGQDWKMPLDQFIKDIRN